MTQPCKLLDILIGCSNKVFIVLSWATQSSLVKSPTESLWSFSNIISHVFVKCSAMSAGFITFRDLFDAFI